MTRSKGKKSNLIWVAQVVHISEPHVSSPAALALLAKHYYALDRTIYSELRMTRIRNKWMKLQMKTHLDKDNGITCNICGKTGLLPHSPDRKKKATLDHIRDIDLGGQWNDPANFQVTCYQCNQTKNNIKQKQHKVSFTCP